MAFISSTDREVRILLRILSVLAIAALMALTVWTGSR